MDQNEAETASVFSNNTRSVLYCQHDPELLWDLNDSTSPRIFAAVASIISLTAIVLNALIIIAVNQRRELQLRLSNIVLSSMAVADLLVGGLCVPLSAVVGLLLPYQILSDQRICMLDFVAVLLTVTLSICSLLHLTIIAWERYVAIHKWIDYKLIVTGSRLKKLAIIAWVSAILGLSPPQFIIATVLGGNAKVLALKILIIVLSVLIVGILVLMIYAYIMVYLGVRKSKLSEIRQVSVLVNVKLERRVAMTTALVTVALILSFLPSVLGGVLQAVYPVLRQRLAMRVAETFLYLNSVVNPLIYCYRDCRFRNAVLEILRMKKPKVRPFVATDAVRFVRRKDLSGSVKDKVQIQKVENPVRLTRSASWDLVLFVDQAHLESHKASLKRTMLSPSLPISSFHEE